ncbi:hypothetical protein Poly51_01680 [Rubripirellula tenax]|uniref:Uncharacterized protein n=1 Tax=Rubripirellula tenax TaxID=2528015 RepID=A0A5C6FGD5_9BACT|nr:hypothetical protein [Rubripirellula tenax]TWU59895.1 hypothetical protein Poly51_01680 [Rubripirellula tenax]
MSTRFRSPTASATAATMLRSFELLPPTYRYEQFLTAVRLGYLTVIAALTAIFVSAAAATTMRRTAQQHRHQTIASEAVPLMAMRQAVMRLQTENERRSGLCQQVQSAKPNDDILQTVAAIAASTADFDDTISIDSLHVRLPIEFETDSTQSTAPKIPTWASPHLNVLAKVADTATALQWLDRMNAHPRISSATTLDALPTVEENQLLRFPITIKANPIASGTLP